MKIVIALAASMLTFNACGVGGSTSPSSSPSSSPTGSSAPDAATVATACTAACAHYAVLGCLAAKPTAHGGVSCVDVCANAVSSGLIHWNLACRAAASSCAEAESCERSHP